MTKFNINNHIKKQGDEYIVTAPVVLIMCSDAIHSPDSGKEGKARAHRVIENIVLEGQKRKFPQIDVLETMLLRGDGSRKLLPLCDRLIKHIGAEAFTGAIERAGFKFRDGGLS